MITLSAFMYFMAGLFNTIVTGSFWFSPAVTLIFSILYNQWFVGFIFSAQPVRLVGVWFPIFNLIGAFIGYMFIKYPMKKIIISNVDGGLWFAIFGVLLLEWLTFWFFGYFDLPLKIIVWYLMFIFIWIALGWLYKYYVGMSELHKNELRSIHGAEIGTGYPFESSQNVFGFFCWTSILFTFVTLGQFFLYLYPNTISTDVDLYATFISALMAVVIVIFAHFATNIKYVIHDK